MWLLLWGPPLLRDLPLLVLDSVSKLPSAATGRHSRSPEGSEELTCGSFRPDNSNMTLNPDPQERGLDNPKWFVYFISQGSTGWGSCGLAQSPMMCTSWETTGKMESSPTIRGGDPPLRGQNRLPLPVRESGRIVWNPSTAQTVYQNFIKPQKYSGCLTWSRFVSTESASFSPFLVRSLFLTFKATPWNFSWATVPTISKEAMVHWTFPSFLAFLWNKSPRYVWNTWKLTWCRVCGKHQIQKHIK